MRAHAHMHVLTMTHSHAHKILDHVIFMCFFFFFACVRSARSFLLHSFFFHSPQIMSCARECVCEIWTRFHFYAVSIFWSLSFARFYTHFEMLYDAESESFCSNDEMLHVIVHSSLNVSGEQLTDFRCLLFIFVPYFSLCFRFFSASLFGISRTVVWWFFATILSSFVVVCVFQVLCTLYIGGGYTSIYITWYSLYFMWHFLFIHVAVVATAVFFLLLIIAAHHHFYGAKFVVIAHIKHTNTRTQRQRKWEGEKDLHLYCHHTILNMLCTAFHHNLWIWIRSSKKGRGITHTHTQTHHT